MVIKARLRMTNYTFQNFSNMLLGANGDRVDHIRLLGNNTWGFEDLAGAGDGDFNDVIVKMNLTI